MPRSKVFDVGLADIVAGGRRPIRALRASAQIMTGKEKKGDIIHLLTPDRWPDLEDLFGPERGANSGCWCMWPRIRGVDFKAMRKEDRKAVFA